MKAIVAADLNWGIGANGNLLRRIRADLKQFKSLTTGNIIVLGRKTLDTFPDKKPLPNRTNVIITRNTNFIAEGSVVVHSVEQAAAYCATNGDKTAYLCGGGEIYASMLKYCDETLLTQIYDVCKADVFLENLDENDDWSLTSSSEFFIEDGVKFRFLAYKNLNPSPLSIKSV